MCMSLVATPAIFKRPGDGIYIGLQDHRAVKSHWSFSAQGTGQTGEGAPVQPVTHGSALSVGLLTADVAVTG